MDFFQAHVGLVYPIVAALQLVVCGVPTILFLLCTKRRSPLSLGALLAGVHLCLIGVIAVVAARMDDLAWIGASLLDVPAVLWFPKSEKVLSMPAFFAIVGTGQYFVVGVLLGIACNFARTLWKGKAVAAALACFLTVCTADAAGPLTHCEMGRRAWEDYLKREEAMFPGISAFWSNDALKYAFYSGCTFPDTMQDGINGDAAEYAHWYEYQKAYADVLKQKVTMPWNEEALRRIAFYFGIVCHDVGDIPWHFDEGPHKSLISACQEHDKVGHFIDHAGEVFSQVLFDLDGIRMPGHFYWAQDDAFEAFQCNTINVTRKELQEGCERQETEWDMAATLAPLAYPVFQWKWPWSRAHFEDYYYGGVDSGAALTAACLRYCYATLQGWHLYQNVFVKNAVFSKDGPHSPITDGTVQMNDPQQVTVKEEVLSVSKTAGAETQAFLRVALDDLAASSLQNEAALWLYLTAPPEKSMTVGIHAIESPAIVAKEATSSLSLQAGEGPGWRKWNVAPLVRQWAEKPSTNLGIRVAVDDGEGVVAFHSSDAMKARPDGYGGSVMAYRPMLIVR